MNKFLAFILGKAIVLLFMAVLQNGCSLTNTVAFNIEHDSYFESVSGHSFYYIHFMRKEHLFRYDSFFFDGHRFGLGHWITNGSKIMMVFDVKPTVDRYLEGQIYGDSIFMLYEQNRLIRYKYTYSGGYTILDTIGYKRITKEYYNQVVK